jgi:ABC-2 type transport system ATP-binding protein
LNVILQNIGKKYNYHWIFRQITYEWEAPAHLGILGNNGSGKTTLLKLICGFLTPSEGRITWTLGEKNISDSVFRYTGIASPHLELIEEFSLRESIGFHSKFRGWIEGHNPKTLIQISGLEKSADKPIKYFSSGMKQRVKLLFAVMSNNPLIILDEPCSNLDEQSIAWYQQLIEDFSGKRLLIIGSNDKDTECFSCKSFINLSQLL